MALRRSPSHAARRALAPIALATAALGLASGCVFHRLGQDLRTLETYGTVRGTVSAPPAAAPSIVVLAITGAPGAEHVVDSFVLGRPGPYFLTLPAGTYRIAAFADRAGKGVYEPDIDPVARPSAAGTIALTGGAVRQGVDLSFAGGATRPLGVSFRLPAPGERVVHLLPDVHVGEVTSLDDPRFARENAKLGMWEPVKFLFDVGAGIYFLEPYDPAKIPVLFVHGVAGTPDDFRTLIAHLDRKRFQPWVLYYPSGLDLGELGRGVDRWMERLHVEDPFPRLVVVAYSMGGLVSRAFLNEALDTPGGGVADALCLFVTLSTPWGGQRAAAWGVAQAPAVAPSWRNLAPGSPFLQALLAKPLPPHIPHDLLFSFGGKSRLLDVANDGVVTLWSELTPAAQAGARRLYGFDTTHTGILREEAVWRLLSQLLASAAAPGGKAVDGGARRGTAAQL
jgi:hypothetical protein